jgi:hypothetical protein
MWAHACLDERGWRERGGRGACSCAHNERRGLGPRLRAVMWRG